MSELEISVCIRWTVDTRSKPGFLDGFRSSTLRTRDGEWRLYYFYPNFSDHHVLRLLKISEIRLDPFDVSVHLEFQGRKRRIARKLSQKIRCTDGNEIIIQRGKLYGWDIWSRSVSDIEGSYPDFHRDGHLRFVVDIRDGHAASMLTDVRSTTAQTKDIGEPRPTASTSVQAECCRTASTSVQTTLYPSACLENLSDDLSKMLDQGSDPDVEFQCGGVSTRAHGALVSARSEVIGSMVSSDMLEGRTRVVKIPNMEPDVFQHFLRYLYTGTLPELTVDLALDLYESGDQYAVLGLAKKCSQYLLEHLSVQDACDVLTVADAHGNAELKEAVIDFMLVNRVPRASDRWKDFCKGHPMLAIEVLDRFCPGLDP